MEQEQPLEGVLPLGMTVKILSGKTNTWRDCTVVQHRYEADEFQIQVHYLGFHERHDEWISVEKDMHRIKDASADDDMQQGAAGAGVNKKRRDAFSSSTSDSSSQDSSEESSEVRL